MPEVCLDSWQGNPCESVFRHAWRSWDLIERGFFVALALMLAYTAYALVRFLLRTTHYDSQNFEETASTQLLRSKRLLAEMSPSMGALRGIAATAPYLGLAGTAYGILIALWFSYSGSPERYLAIISARIAGAMTATLAGILVAVAAAVLHDFLRSRLEPLPSAPNLKWARLVSMCSDAPVAEAVLGFAAIRAHRSAGSRKCRSTFHAFSPLSDSHRATCPLATDWSSQRGPYS